MPLLFGETPTDYNENVVKMLYDNNVDGLHP